MHRVLTQKYLLKTLQRESVQCSTAKSHSHGLLIIQSPDLLTKFVKWLSKPGKNRNLADEKFDSSTIMLADLMVIDYIKNEKFWSLKFRT